MSFMTYITRFLGKETPPPAPPSVAAKSGGPISARQITLVQSTWEQVLPIADQAALLFYNKLFDLDPNLKPLFTTDIEAQGKKLMQMITVAVKGLPKLDSIVPAVQQLGIRHVQYGVKAEHYNTVAAALLWTLEQGLGEAFTPEVKAAWVTAYTLLATTMQEAAATVAR
jgi:hemoglobin-like flavoprotein